MPSAFRRAGAAAERGTTTTPGVGTASDHGTGEPPSLLPSSPLRGTTTTAAVAATAAAVPLRRGVRPWQGGTYLTSAGLNDLDVVLGGGQPLGTCLTVLEDRWTADLALSLVRYWCAEALSQEQHLIVPILEGTVGGSDGGGSLPTWGAAPANERLELEELLLSLPRNLHWDKDRKRQEEKAVTAEGAARSSRRPIALDVLAEGDEDGDGHDDDDDSPPAPAVDDDEGLVVAWQYRASVQRERLATGAQTRSTASAGSGSRSVFCHSYDLSGRMADQILIDPKANVVPLLSSSSSSSGGSEATDSMQGRGMDLFRDLVAVLKERATTAPEQGTAIRLLLYHPSMDSLAVALPLLLAHIRNEGLPVVVMVCTRPSQDVRSWIQLARTSDIVLRTEGFASRKEYPPPAEFRHLQGVLNVDKTTRKPTEIAALIYGFKRDRRKLHIQLLHIPPEDYAEGGGSVGAGGVRSGAGRPASTADEAHGTRTTPKTKPSGMGCSANFSGSALDF